MIAHFNNLCIQIKIGLFIDDNSMIRSNCERMQDFEHHGETK